MLVIGIFIGFTLGFLACVLMSANRKYDNIDCTVNISKDNNNNEENDDEGDEDDE